MRVHPEVKKWPECLCTKYFRPLGKLVVEGEKKKHGRSQQQDPLETLKSTSNTKTTDIIKCNIRVCVDEVSPFKSNLTAPKNLGFVLV